MVKRVVTMAVVLALILGIGITGCSKKEDVAKSTASVEDTKQTETKQEETTKAEPVNLVLFGYKVGDEAKAIPGILKSFEEANPGMTVTYNSMSEGYLDAAKAKLASGTDEFDVFMGWKSDIALYADAGYVVDLTGESFIQNYLDAMQKLMEYKGKQYCIPIEQAGLGMFANMTILEKNGLKAPANWTEFLDVCEKLKAANVLPMVMGNKTGWCSGIMAQQGMVYERDKNAGLATEVAEGAKGADALYGPILQKLKIMIDKGYINAKESIGMEFNEEAFKSFLKGDAAFNINGTWMTGQIDAANTGMKFQLLPMPFNDGDTKAFTFPGVVVFINGKSPKIEASKKLLDFLSQDQNIKSFVDSESAFTVLKGGTSNVNPINDTYANYVKDGKIVSEGAGLERFDVWTPITKGTQMMMIGKATPESVIKDVDASLEKTRKLQ